MKERTQSGAPLMTQGQKPPARAYDGEVFIDEAVVKSCCNSKTAVAFLCALCTIIAILVTVLATFIFGNLHIESKTFMYCVECDFHVAAEEKGLQTEAVVKINRTVKGRDIQMCCWPDSSGFKSAVNKHVSSATTQVKQSHKENLFPPFPVGDHIPRSSVNHTIPVVAAHLTLQDKRAKKSESDGLFNILGWSNQTEERGMVRRSVRYRKGRLLVVKAGIYYIYSQVHFLEKPQFQGQPYLSKSVSHYVYKYNRNLPHGGEQCLLQNSRSRCQKKDTFLEYSSYLGAVFRLQAGEEIFVKVNNWTAVHAEGSSTYFGLYMLDSVDKTM